MSLIINSFSYHKLVYFNLFFLRGLIYGLIFTFIIYSIRKKKIIPLKILGQIGITFFITVAFLNIVLFLSTSNIDIKKIEKYCSTDKGYGFHDSQIRMCQLDSLNLLAQKEKNSNCKLVKSVFPFNKSKKQYDYMCLVNYFDKKYPNLFCSENMKNLSHKEKKSCEQWQELIDTVKRINKFNKEHPLQICSKITKEYADGFTYEYTKKESNYKISYDNCILNNAIINKDSDYCNEIQFSEELKNKCLLNAKSNFKNIKVEKNPFLND